MPNEPTEDGVLLALLDRYAETIRALALRHGVGLDCERSRAALLAHIDRWYIRRDHLPLDDARATYTVRTRFVSAGSEVAAPPDA
jgi:hypothetical protein